VVVNRVAVAIVAGAAGTLALEAATYADMVLRGRPVSTVPQDAIRRGARRIGLRGVAGDEPAARHRREGLAALGGIATGLSVGALHGMLLGRRSRLVVDVLAAGGVAMIAGNAGAVAAGVTDPRRWRVSDWLADLLPHLCFGIGTAVTWRAIRAEAAR
jgi:hypothetical protein